jgi:thiosulfate dehydrogenase
MFQVMFHQTHWNIMERNAVPEIRHFQALYRSRGLGTRSAKNSNVGGGMRALGWLAWGMLGACGGEAPSPEPTAPEPAPAPPVEAPAAAPTPHGEVADWQPPAKGAFPPGPLGESVKRGLDLFTHTSERLPEYSPGTLACSSCHLDEGRKAGAAPVIGVAARFPKYMDRTGSTIALADRVNYCFTRSLAGSRIPTESEEMTDLLAYMTWLSEGLPIGANVPGEGMAKMPDLHGDAARGEALYTEKGCVACHQTNGEGVPPTFPALWGDRSYSIGASMAREERAASFIQHFMPQTAPGSLSDQEAFDLSAFINSKPRRDSPGKEYDWPDGGAPADVPYDTVGGHVAHRPPPLLPRPNPELAVVARPPSVRATP